MKNSPWFLPVLGVGTSVVAILASYLILRFAPSPVEIATAVVGVLLVALAALGVLATRRGQAATFVAIALVLPYLMFASVTYGAAERVSSEFGEELGDFEDFEEGDGTYGSNPALDELQDDCLAGDEDACDELYLESPAGSEYESTAEENGGG